MLLMGLSAFAAYFIKGLCGFANTLVFTAILSFGMNNVNISPIELIVGMPSNMIVAWKERRHINWRIALPVAGLVLLGDVPGVFLLRSAGAAGIKVLLGGVIILLGANMMYREKHPVDHPPARWLTTLVALLSGLLCGLYGIGAVLAAFISRMSPDAHTARGTMNVVFIADNLFRVTAYTLMGLLTWDAARQALTVIPFMLAGLLAGMKLIDRVNERAAKLIVIVALMISGAALIASNV